MIKLSDKVKDMITGFEGIAIARTVYLNDSVLIQVQPEELKDGEIIESEWIDELRLVHIKEKLKGG